MTTWNTSPSMMCWRDCSTARSYTCFAVRKRSSGWGMDVSRTLTRNSPGVGVAASRSIVSRRATAARYASSARVGLSSTFTALAMSHMEPETWSTTAMSVANASTSSFCPVSSGAVARNVGSQCRIASHPTVPTNPLVRLGSPSTRGALSASSVARATSMTSPCEGTPTGTVPSQFACPPSERSWAMELTPMKLYRLHDPPYSADSRMKVPDLPFARRS